MPVQDQAVWKSVNIVVGGKPTVFSRGDLLPPPATDAEANQRMLARIGGALRVVEVVFTPDELRARSQLHGQGPAEAAATAGITAVTATVAPAPGSDPRSAAGAPVVLGPKPASHATKREWHEYAVTHGLTAEAAEGMTRDAIVQHFRDDPGG